MEKARATLKEYEGTHNYHNYTSQKKFSDPSAKRYIMYFQVGSAECSPTRPLCAWMSLRHIMRHRKNIPHPPPPQ